MLIKIYWKWDDIKKEIYTLRKATTKIMGFTYPIKVKGHRYLPHWTYHSDRNRKPKIHHRSRSGKVLDFMTLEEPYLKEFDRFEGIVWSAPGFGAPFNLLHAINIEGHPEEAQRDIIFSIKKTEFDWTHYLNILLVERPNYTSLAKTALNQIAKGYDIIRSEMVDDGTEPNILVVFSKNKIDQVNT